MFRRNESKEILLDWVRFPDAEFFRALSNVTRKRILEVVINADTSLKVSDIGEEVGVKQYTATKHLNILSRSGWLIRERQENEVHYRLNPNVIGVLQKISVSIQGAMAKKLR